MILEAAADHDTGLVSRGVRHDGIVAGGSGNSDSHREELNQPECGGEPSHNFESAHDHLRISRPR